MDLFKKFDNIAIKNNNESNVIEASKQVESKNYDEKKPLYLRKSYAEEK